MKDRSWKTKASQHNVELIVEHRLDELEPELRREAEVRLAPREVDINKAVSRRLNEVAEETAREVEAMMQPTRENINAYVANRRAELRALIRAEVLKELAATAGRREPGGADDDR